MQVFLIPQTILPISRGGDGDPLDVIILGKTLSQGEVIKVKPLGIMRMTDGGEQDDKIIAVPLDSELSQYNNLDHLKNEKPEILKNIRSWFINYKGGNIVKFKEFMSEDDANELIRMTERYFKRFGLKERVNLSFRVEEKLFIEKKNLLDFKKFLSEKFAKKIYEPRIIESLYFDNHNLQTYHDSVEGLVPRKKIRLRTYPNNNDENLYLEIKHSSIEGRFKTRKKINNKEFEEKISSGIFDNNYGLCTPKLYVKYKREYLFIKDFRISIDTDITYRNFITNYQCNDDR